MKTIKLGILGLGIIASSFAFSQEGNRSSNKEEPMEQRMNMLEKELGLSEVQVTQITALRDKTRQSIQ